MTKRRPYIGPSEAQANAEALMRRSAPYTAAADASFKVAWDWRQRQPRDLREAVRMVRAAYSSEVPSKLHDGPDAIGPDGTPRMTARAESYIFGDGRSDDSVKGKCICKVHPTEASRQLGIVVEHGDDCPANPKNQDMVGYYHAPFRARLAEMSAGDERERKRAAIVSHVSIGSQAPVEAAIAEGVPAWCARLVAEDALRFFLHSMSDLRLHLPQGDPLAEGVTAA